MIEENARDQTRQETEEAEVDRDSLAGCQHRSQDVDELNNDELDEELEGLDEEVDEGVDEKESQIAANPARVERTNAAQPHSDDLSIDDYMAALLNRMRGGKPSEVVIAAQPKRNKRKSDSVPAEQRPAVDPSIRDVTSGHVVDMPMGAAELSRRSAPAEKTDLTAMRELANTQATIAITRFSKKGLHKKAVRDFSLGLLCVAATLFVLAVTPKSVTALRTKYLYSDRLWSN